ncbi:MAG: DUF1566 domain-containing protein [bacterium]
MSEELKPTQDVPVAEAKAEGQKLEWGPDLGRMSWNEVQVKITDLNSKLAEGEKNWRLPTRDELCNMFDMFDKTGSTPAGFSPRGVYWSDTVDPVSPDFAYSVRPAGGYVYNDGTVTPSFLVRCVR